MKASQLIKNLKKAIKEYGDREVYFDLLPTGLVDQGDDFQISGIREETAVVSARFEGPKAYYSRRVLLLRPDYES